MLKSEIKRCKMKLSHEKCALFGLIAIMSVILINGQRNGTTTTSTCTTNETLAQSGQDCLTCSNPTGSCPLVNLNRCYCRAGYVRNATNSCILSADCPSEAIGGCFPNATVFSMSSNCLTCDNYRTASCPLSTQSKCYCKDGYVLDLDNNRCVLPVDCTVFQTGQCRANQTFSDRGYDCITCANYQTNRECYQSYQSKCYCNVGFMREVRTQRCVRLQDCSTDIRDKCSLNQTLSNFGYDCATCVNPLALCRPTNQRKCYCLNGYVRTVSGDCVLEEDCLGAVTLPAGANCRDPRGIGCNPDCVPTCRRRRHGFLSLLCRQVCEACYCPSGQVRDDNGNCIPEKQCPEYPYNFPHYRFAY